MARPTTEDPEQGAQTGSYADALSPLTDLRSSLPSSMRALIDTTTANAASSTQMLAELAPQLLQHRMLHTQPPASQALDRQRHQQSTSIVASAVTFARRLPGITESAPSTSVSLAIRERIDDLLALPIPSVAGPSSIPLEEPVSLLTGFKATAPASNAARIKRRRRRAGLGEDGSVAGSALARLAIDAPSTDKPIGRRQSAVGLGTPRKSRRRSLASVVNGHVEQNLPEPTRAELEQEVEDIMQDQINLDVRKHLLSDEIGEVDRKIAALDALRQTLRRDLLALREEHLALADELEGTREQMNQMDAATKGRAVSAPSSRRRKGPTFLPSEHDELPLGVSFLSLVGHLDTITALDFTEPYGTLVSASADESLRMWDLSTGEEVGFLRGHDGTVKCLQVEGPLCISGGQDGTIRLWDLEKAEEDAAAQPKMHTKSGLASLKEEDEDHTGLLTGDKGDSACMQTLTGHASAVTACYFEENCLVTGSSDKTLRQWDLTTGQCVMTMDILWAISHPSTQLTASPPPSPPSSALPASDSYFDLPEPPIRSTPKRTSLATLRRLSSQPYGLSTPALTMDSSRSLLATLDTALYDSDDYAVGGVMHWGYALASGSADGCVRMWDMRTGQAHRTLVGHVAPVSCLQFDEYHLVSGSLDKSIRIWDLRTGAIADTLRYDRPVTALQFDSRKIVAAAGENGVKVYNRTTLQHTTLSAGGHNQPATRLRFMDRFLATGGRDSTVRLWAIA